MSEEFDTTNDYMHISKDGKTLIFDKTLKKDWIKLPSNVGELSGKKSKIIEQIQSLCCCDKHFTTMYLLEDKYTTMYCNTVKQWAWVITPRKEFLQNLRNIEKKNKEKKLQKESS